MYPIVGRYGPYFLYSYMLVAGIGYLLALVLTAYLARQRRLTGWLDGVLWATVAALLAGRLAFVLLNIAYFAEHPSETWRLWLGGLNHHAALGAGLLAYWIWTRATGRSFAAYAGLIAPGLALLSSALWTACWFEGCAYGEESVPGLFTADRPDGFGVFAVRYRVQEAGALLSVGIAAIALWLGRRWPPLPVFWLTLLLLSLSALGLSILRGDTALNLGAWPAGAVINGLAAVASAIGLIVAMRRNRSLAAD